MMVGLGVVGRVMVLVDAMVSPGVGLCCVFGWVYVDGFDGARGEVGVFWVCDVPVSYAKTVDYRYGSAGPCAQMCGAGFWVSE